MVTPISMTIRSNSCCVLIHRRIALHEQRRRRCHKMELYGVAMRPSCERHVVRLRGYGMISAGMVRVP
jgi:hypothetical protein